MAGNKNKKFRSKISKIHLPRSMRIFLCLFLFSLSSMLNAAPRDNDVSTDSPRLAETAATETDNAERTLVIGVTPRPVFVTVDEQGKVGGLDIALAKAIFAEAGLQIEFQVYPWKRIVHMLSNGDLDVALSASDTAKRQEFAHFSSETFRLGHNLLFARKGQEARFDPAKGLTQLSEKPIRLGVQRGVSYSYEYDRMLESEAFRRQLVVVDTPPRLVELMLFNRVDAFLGSERDLQTEITKQGAQDKIVPVFYLMSDEEASSHIMFSKASVQKQWVERVNQAMRSLKASGRYDEILGAF
jgi:ABC-type amino acid transport substrate-binding protein